MPAVTNPPLWYCTSQFIVCLVSSMVLLDLYGLRISQQGIIRRLSRDLCFLYLSLAFLLWAGNGAKLLWYEGVWRDQISNVISMANNGCLLLAFVHLDYVSGRLHDWFKKKASPQDEAPLPAPFGRLDAAIILVMLILTVLMLVVYPDSQGGIERWTSAVSLSVFGVGLLITLFKRDFRMAAFVALATIVIQAVSQIVHESGVEVATECPWFLRPFSREPVPSDGYWLVMLLPKIVEAVLSIGLALSWVIQSAFEDSRGSAKPNRPSSS